MVWWIIAAGLLAFIALAMAALLRQQRTPRRQRHKRSAQHPQAAKLASPTGPQATPPAAIIQPPTAVPPTAIAQLGPYTIIKQLGHGAMGAVYLGQDATTGRQAALKTLAMAREFSGTDLIDVRERFLREAQLVAKLNHPDIVRVWHSGETQGLAYMAMEVVSGVELSAHCQANDLLDWRDVATIGARVADALAYAHSQGITHRDIKPANIMFDAATGAVKLMDFGVALVADATRTRTGVVLGTPCYMSPEQLGGQTIDGRSDLYALGVTLFQLLTGRLPHTETAMGALMKAVAQNPAPHISELRPDLPRSLGDVVDLALQKHPSTRYANGQQLADDLRAVLAMNR
jgi:serine/threonine protein kinase